MLAELAVRNVKRQVGNYLIYFLTVAFTVALIFAINNVIFCSQLMQYAEVIEQLKYSMITFTIFVSLIVAFVLGYATSFMLKLRKREFGVYLTLGMTRKNILILFIFETLLLCAAALAVGILLGFVLYQGLMAILSSLMEIDLSFAPYSLQGLVLTVVLVVGIFILSSITSALYLKKVSVYQLIHGDKKVERGVKYPMFWMFVTIISLAVGIGSFLLFDHELRQAFLFNRDPSALLTLGSIAALAVCLMTFHTGLSKSAVYLLLKSKAICSKGTHTFTLRQLSGKLSSNAVMSGILSFLIAFAIIGSNVSFVQKMSDRLTLDRGYPFDITASFDAGGQPGISLKEGEAIISKYATIEKKLPYTLYTTGNGDLHSFTKWSGEQYGGIQDTVMSESDFNRVYTAKGHEPIHLDGTFRIYVDMPQAKQYDFSSAQLTLNGKTYPFGGISDDIPIFAYVYFIAVVPDEAVQGLAVETECMAYDLADGDFDAAALRDELSYEMHVNVGDKGEFSYMMERCDFSIREYGKRMRNGNTAIFILAALYIAVVFVFMAMAVLALKTLSGLTDDQRKYSVLFRLGASEQERKQALFRQTACFFFLPFALPVLLGIPTAWICGKLLDYTGFGSQAYEVYLNAGWIALVVTSIYALYFAATYLTAKKNVLLLHDMAGCSAHHDLG